MPWPAGRSHHQCLLLRRHRRQTAHRTGSCCDAARNCWPSRSRRHRPCASRSWPMPAHSPATACRLREGERSCHPGRVRAVRGGSCAARSEHCQHPCGRMASRNADNNRRHRSDSACRCRAILPEVCREYRSPSLGRAYAGSSWQRRSSRNASAAWHWWPVNDKRKRR